MEPLPYSSGSAKRAKAPGNITQVAHCLVDGCNADLSLCRDYHRRHKVCEAHSKTPIVTIGGREQRFCQQCSRFHSLVEFDEGKRSCRKRLDGHNRRRRKPQPDSINRNSGLVFSAQQSMSGVRLLSFANPQILPSSIVGSSSWAGIVKPENDMALYNNQAPQLSYIETPSTYPECSHQSYKGVNQLQFIQGSSSSDHAYHEPSTAICQPLMDPNAVSGTSSDRALSLLSSAPTSTREFVLNHTVQTEPNLPPQAQPLAHNLHYSGLGRYAAYLQESKPAASASDSHSHGSNTSTTASHQTLTFTWE